MQPLQIVVIVCLFVASLKADKFEAEAELEKTFGRDDRVATEWRNERTSISSFISKVASVRSPLLIVYTTENGKECARILHAFFSRRRSLSKNKGVDGDSRVFMVDASQWEKNGRLPFLYRSIIIGGTDDYPLLKRMASRGRVKAAKNRAQFRLFANPNALAIISESKEIFPSLARVLVKSYLDMDDESYSYFYLE